MPPLHHDVRDQVVPPPPAPPPVGPQSRLASSPHPHLSRVFSARAQLSLLSSAVFACGTVVAGGTAKNTPPLLAGGDGDAVLPTPNNGLTTLVELSRQSSPATSTIGLSLFHRRLLLLTSAIPSSPRPRSLRAWADDGGQIIAPKLPRNVHDQVVPPPPAPPPVDICGPVLSAPPLVACVGRRRRSNYRAASPPRRPRLGRPSSAGASSCQRPWSRPLLC